LKHDLLGHNSLSLSELDKDTLIVKVILFPIVDELLEFLIHRECLLNSIEAHALEVLAITPQRAR
jgi:hypothetical protein